MEFEFHSMLGIDGTFIPFYKCLRSFEELIKPTDSEHATSPT